MKAGFDGLSLRDSGPLRNTSTNHIMTLNAIILSVDTSYLGVVYGQHGMF